MLLAIDIGNTNVVAGIFTEKEEPGPTWRFATRTNKTSDEWWLSFLSMLQTSSIQITEIDAVAIASVVPKVSRALSEAFKNIGIHVSHLDHMTPTEMALKVDNPSEVGPDRIANGLAVRAFYKLPCVVVDFGTATTFDVIDENGDYVGGVILPGVETALEALVNRASALKSISIETPSHVIGKNTVEALQSGSTYGIGAQIDGICKRIDAELKTTIAMVVATGGLGTLAATRSERINCVDQWLTLRGISKAFKER